GRTAARNFAQGGRSDRFTRKGGSDEHAASADTAGNPGRSAPAARNHAVRGARARNSAAVRPDDTAGPARAGDRARAYAARSAAHAAGTHEPELTKGKRRPWMPLVAAFRVAAPCGVLRCAAGYASMRDAMCASASST